MKFILAMMISATLLTSLVGRAEDAAQGVELKESNTDLFFDAIRDFFNPNAVDCKALQIPPTATEAQVVAAAKAQGLDPEKIVKKCLKPTTTTP